MLGELLAWYGGLPADMKFFFALPFLVVAGAFIGEWLRRLART